MNETRRRIAWLVLGFLALFLCTACALRGSPQPLPTPHVGLGATLVVIGQWCIYIGTATVIACTLARVAGLFPITAPFILLASPFITEATALGIATAVLGGVAVWCGVHSWVLYTTALGLALVYAFKHRAGLLAWLNASKAKQVAP